MQNTRLGVTCAYDLEQDVAVFDPVGYCNNSNNTIHGRKTINGFTISQKQHLGE